MRKILQFVTIKPYDFSGSLNSVIDVTVTILYYVTIRKSSLPNDCVTPIFALLTYKLWYHVAKFREFQQHVWIDCRAGS